MIILKNYSKMLRMFSFHFLFHDVDSSITWIDHSHLFKIQHQINSFQLRCEFRLEKKHKLSKFILLIHLKGFIQIENYRIWFDAEHFMHINLTSIQADGVATVVLLSASYWLANALIPSSINFIYKIANQMNQIESIKFSKMSTASLT